MYGFMWIVIISIALILIVMKQECAQFVEERTVIKDNELGSKAIWLDCLRLNSSDEAEDVDDVIAPCGDGQGTF